MLLGVCYALIGIYCFCLCLIHDRSILWPDSHPGAIIQTCFSKKSKKNALLSATLQKEQGILLLIAHPDDECLFFGPTLLYLLKTWTPHQIHLLCLSTGTFFLFI